MTWRTPPAIGNDEYRCSRDALAVRLYTLVADCPPDAAAEVSELARLTGVIQAGRELAHTVSNLLSLPLGVLDLLEAQAGVPPELQSLVAAAREALTSAATQAQDFHALAREALPPADTLPS